MKGDEPIILTEVINYIEESLTNENKLAYHHYLCGHVNQLMMCNPDSIMVACQAVSAMLNLLKHNIKPNMRVAGHKSHYQNVDWRIVPKLQCFTGKLSKGFSFLQLFKFIINNSPNKVITFGALLESEVSL